MKTSVIKLPKTTKRNPLVAPSKTRSGAGKHTDKKKTQKNKPWEQLELDYEN
jgi:hypothetical protein